MPDPQPATDARSRPSPPPRAGRGGLALEDEARGESLRLDDEGRWIAWARAGVLFRRCLDGGVVAFAGRARARLLGPAVDHVHAGAQRAAARWDERAPHALLKVAARRTPQDERDHLALYRAAYAEGIPILPPHRYRDVVVLPALGCPNAACTFCRFYRGRPFRPLSLTAFLDHVQRVRGLLGAGLAERPGVFLGSASAASLPDAPLRDRLERVARLLGPRARGVAAFWDPDRGPARGAARWEALRAAGLADLTVGLETGLAALRRSLGKSADVPRFVARVREAARAGIALSVCVLLGAEEPALREAHREASVSALTSMDLTPRDRVYLSALTPGGRIDAAAEVSAWSGALRARTPAQVSAYGAERFEAWM